MIFGKLWKLLTHFPNLFPQLGRQEKTSKHVVCLVRKENTNVTPRRWLFAGRGELPRQMKIQDVDFLLHNYAAGGGGGVVGGGGGGGLRGWLRVNTQHFPEKSVGCARVIPQKRIIGAFLAAFWYGKIVFPAICGRNCNFWEMHNGNFRALPRKIRTGIPGKRPVMNFCEHNVHFCVNFAVNYAVNIR